MVVKEEGLGRLCTIQFYERNGGGLFFSIEVSSYRRRKRVSDHSCSQATRARSDLGVSSSDVAYRNSGDGSRYPINAPFQLVALHLSAAHLLEGGKYHVARVTPGQQLDDAKDNHAPALFNDVWRRGHEVVMKAKRADDKAAEEQEHGSQGGLGRREPAPYLDLRST